MNKESYGELFNEGYRDPHDDARRLGIYAFLVFGCCAGVWMLVESVREWFWPHPNVAFTDPGMRASGLVMLVLGLVVGLFMSVGSAWILIQESKHWRLKDLTWDKFLYGGIDLGFGIILVGLEFGSGTAHPFGIFALVLIGGSVILFFVYAGLAFALWEKHRPPKTLRNVVVRTRFALDDRFLEVYDHPCPAADGLFPVVELKTVDGEDLKFKASETAYEFASAGTRGHAKVRGKTLLSFRPLLKSG